MRSKSTNKTETKCPVQDTRVKEGLPFDKHNKNWSPPRTNGWAGRVEKKFMS